MPYRVEEKCKICNAENRSWVEFLRYCMLYTYEELIEFFQTEFNDADLCHLNLANCSSHFRRHTSWDSYQEESRRINPKLAEYREQVRREYLKKPRPIIRKWKH